MMLDLDVYAAGDAEMADFFGDGSLNLAGLFAQGGKLHVRKTWRFPTGAFLLRFSLLHDVLYARLRIKTPKRRVSRTFNEVFGGA